MGKNMSVREKKEGGRKKIRGGQRGHLNGNTRKFLVYQASESPEFPLRCKGGIRKKQRPQVNNLLEDFIPTRA